MQDVLINIAVGLLAYLIGSLPFGLWITRWRTGQDIRLVGSGHVGATNAMRAAGWLPGAIVAVLDFAKGWAALSLALRWGTWEGTQAIASAAVVIGHCWPVFAGFRGGMGVGPAAGALAALWPEGLLLAVALGVAMQLLWRHTARGNVVTGVIVGPLWAAASAPAWTAGAAAAAGAVVCLRSISDWNRVYRELWLDRGAADPSPATRETEAVSGSGRGGGGRSLRRSRAGGGGGSGGGSSSGGSSGRSSGGRGARRGGGGRRGGARDRRGTGRRRRQ